MNEIPSIEFVRDCTRYSIQVNKALKIAGDKNPNIYPFEKFISSVANQINSAAANGESFQITYFVVRSSDSEEMIETKKERAKLVSEIFSKFGFKTELFEKDEKYPAIKISW